MMMLMMKMVVVVVVDYGELHSLVSGPVKQQPVWNFLCLVRLVDGNNNNNTRDPPPMYGKFGGNVTLRALLRTVVWIVWL